MVSATSLALDLAFHSDFRNNFSFRPLRKPRILRARFSQEINLSKPAQEQDTAIKGVRTTSVKEDHISRHDNLVHKQNNLPPLVSALKASAEKNTASFHFPGHNRGHAAPASLTQLIGRRPYVHDLPELPELDNLFCPQGPILEAQRQAAKLFGSSETWFLVGGTTCGIQAAIMATCSPGEFLILPRNSHLSAISAMVLSGALPKYIIPEYNNDWDIAGGVYPLQVLNAIQELQREGHEAAAVLITSPTYHGNVVDKERISLCLQTLQTTSPSYLLLASLDAARAQLNESPDSVFNQAIDLAFEARYQLKDIPGISVLENSSFPLFPAIDPLRLTIGFWQLGLSGFEADEILYRDHGIVCELVGNQSITFAFNLGTSKDHVQRLVSGIQHLASVYASIPQPKVTAFSCVAPFDDIIMSLIPRDAFFASKRRVTLRESLGKVSGELICPYPPGIPVLIPGEGITEKAINYLLHVRSKGAVITGASDPSISSIVVCNV
ncbi:hypothetical protein K1719_034663 [Acacia pycnantha]|nr:hypothetical protein K1719_034663 [Acacia pycnantha]